MKRFSNCVLNLVFVTLLTFSFNLSKAQSTQQRQKQMYKEAEKLYLRGNYQGSIDYLENKDKILAGSSDSLIYLKIINLNNIYLNSNENTKRLESTIDIFFHRARKYIFPENKFNEVVVIYTKVKQFKETDSKFYTNAVIPPEYISISTLNNEIEKINHYLGINKNSYYSNELNEIISGKSTLITKLEQDNLKKLKDSTFRSNLQLIGKKTILTLSYSAPTHKSAIVLNNENDILNLLDGESNNIIKVVPDYVLGASLFDFCGNLFLRTRFKIGLIFTLLDFHYQTINFDQNTILQKSLDDSSKLKQIYSINAGARVGLMASYMITEKITVAPYISIIPAANFLTSALAYKKKNETSGAIESYEIKQKFENFNLSYEFGLKFYFFKNLYLGFFIHNGLENWANIASRKSIKNSEVNLKADHNFQTYGIRIGL